MSSGKTVLGIAVLLLALLLVACSPIRVLNTLSSSGDYDSVRGIAYGPEERHDLDVYAPGRLACREPCAADAPVVVFFYGGGWESGDKDTYLFAGAALATLGFVTVIPNYRLYPAVRFPAFVEDAALAVRWVKEHAARFGGDPDRIVLMGHSAGAHIAAMLAFDARWLAAVDLDPSRDLRGMIGLSGPYDFLPLHNDTLQDIFGPEDTLAETQPIHFADGTAPPAFLATGRRDLVVDPGNTTRMAQRIRETGGDVEVEIYPWVGHPLLLGAFAPPLRWLSPVRRDVADFIRRVTDSAPADSTVRHRDEKSL